jgi:hypothetical protein
VAKNLFALLSIDDSLPKRTGKKKRLHHEIDSITVVDDNDNLRPFAVTIVWCVSVSLLNDVDPGRNNAIVTVQTFQN